MHGTFISFMEELQTYFQKKNPALKSILSKKSKKDLALEQIYPSQSSIFSHVLQRTKKSQSAGKKTRKDKKRQRKTRKKI
jgi:hypothetical protein